MSATLVSLTDEKSFPLNRPSIFVGRDRWRVDVCLTGDEVDEVHCELVQQGSGFRLINLSSGGTLVNGEAVSEAVLHDGDEVTIATHRLRLSCSDANEARVDVWSDAAAEAEWAAVNHFDQTAAAPEVEATPPASLADADLNAVNETAFDSTAIESPESHRWKVQLAGMELGPIPWAELQQMVQTGQAQPSDPVRAEEMSDWLPYSAVAAGPKAAAEPAVEPAPRKSSPSLLPSGEKVAAGRMSGQQSEPEDTKEPLDKPIKSKSHSEPLADELPPVEPQYFVILDESDSPTETGPVPLEALQQLALEFRLTGVTRVRREDESEWSAAGALAIDFPPPPTEEKHEVPEAKPKQKQESQPQKPSRNLVTGIAWVFLAPVYTLSDAIRGLLSMSKKAIAITAVVAVAVGFLLFTWIKGWSQTALTGTLTLDGDPVPAVFITLTGMMTGDSAVGITDSSGRFSAITLDGELLPGNYHVTVVKSDSGSQQGEDALVRIPMKYQSIGTTDLIIEVKEDVSYYDIPISAKISGTLVDQGR